MTEVQGYSDSGGLGDELGEYRRVESTLLGTIAPSLSLINYIIAHLRQTRGLFLLFFSCFGIPSISPYTLLFS
jgi:hypothetical protein